MTVIWTGVVDERGRLKLDDRARFDAYLRVALTNKRVDLSVVQHGEKRSIAQNAWLWGAFYPALAEHLGYDFHEHTDLHYDLLGVRFGTHEVTSRIPSAPRRIVPKQTTSRMTTAEFSDHMEWLVRYAATKFGVVVALPDEPREREQVSQ